MSPRATDRPPLLGSRRFVVRPSRWLLLFAVLPLALALPLSAQVWEIEVVDAVGDVGLNTSLALDGLGNPHISYCTLTGLDLKYAYRDVSGWSIQTVDAAGVVGLYPSLALDASGWPHISYYEELPNLDLKYAYCDASGWNIQTLDAAGNVGESNSLAVDASGCPHISYSDQTNLNLEYAYRDDTGWHIETADAEGRVGEYTSLALDGSGWPHISYRQGDVATALKYAYRDASGWHTQTVDSTWDVGEWTSLALDCLGCPHISYFDETYDDLKYAYIPAPPPIALDGELSHGELQLTWGTVTQAAAYWVYGASNLPWFVPGMAPGYDFRLDVVPNGTTTWSSSNGIGDPNINWTYLVMAMDASEAELARSNRVGEEDFETDIP